MKRGLTLVELVVSMGVFVIIMTLAVGGFVTVSRMKALSSTMKETQQKTRIAQEMITRLARQAEKVVISDSGKILDLYFEINSPSPQGARFRIHNGGLFYSDCAGPVTCSFSSGTNLYTNIELADNSRFTKVGSVPPTLEVDLYGKIIDMNNLYYSDEINLNTKIILERIR